MSESVTVFTVPDDWTARSSLASNDSEAIVGTLTAQGDELWLPHEKSEYFVAGGYCGGYSPADAQESSITLGDGMSARLTEFFNKVLLGDDSTGVSQRYARYDCHWFANWLDGQVNLSNTVIDSVRMSKEIVKDGSATDDPIGLGEIGVLTRISKTKNIFPEHTFVSIGENRAIHAMGRNGKIAISPQDEIFQYYEERCFDNPQISDMIFEDPNKLELYTTSSNL